MTSTRKSEPKRHWEQRDETNWSRFEFNQPYQRGLKRLQQVLDTTNYDPTVLWQWGTMQAMAIIEILQTVEQRFGRAGQQAVLDSLRRIGYDIGRQITEGTSVPPDMTNAEWISFYATVINRIAYASLERPTIEHDAKASFHIEWCPHQDHYAALDCRVQRYFVQGMIDAAMDYMREQGREAVWDVVFTATIPAGAPTCHFEIERGSPETARKWAEYTRLIEDKALEIAARRKLPDEG